MTAFVDVIHLPASSSSYVDLFQASSMPALLVEAIDEVCSRCKAVKATRPYWPVELAYRSTEQSRQTIESLRNVSGVNWSVGADTGLYSSSLVAHLAFQGERAEDSAPTPDTRDRTYHRQDTKIHTTLRNRRIGTPSYALRLMPSMHRLTRQGQLELLHVTLHAPFMPLRAA